MKKVNINNGKANKLLLAVKKAFKGDAKTGLSIAYSTDRAHM